MGSGLDRPRRINDEDGVVGKKKGNLRGRTYPPNPQNKQRKKKSAKKKKENATTTTFYPKELKPHRAPPLSFPAPFPLSPTSGQNDVKIVRFVLFFGGHFSATYYC